MREVLCTEEVEIYNNESMSIKDTSSRKCAEWYLETPIKGNILYDTTPSELLL